MSEAAKFDHVVTNKQGELNETVSEIQEILADERLREPPRCVRL
jgi:guanylate kinase